MLKQKRQLFEVLFMVADLVTVSVAWLLAYWLRFVSNVVPVHKGIPSLDNYLSMLLFIWLIWVFVYRRFGLYRPMRGVRRAYEVWLLIRANALAVLLLIAVTYLFREKAVPFSRLVFVYFGVIAVGLTILERTLLRYMLRDVRRKGYNLRYMLIVGAGKVAGDIASRVRLHRELGIQLIGCLSKEELEARGPKGLRIVGKYNDLSRILREMDIDQVMIALPLEDNHLLPTVINQIGDSLVDVKIVPDLYQFVSIGGAIEESEGLPVISVQGSPIEGINLFAKRVFDFVLATVFIVLFSPLMLLIAMLIKLTSSGPIFYVQERASVDGNPFKIIKFRTMKLDAERAGPQWCKSGDRRITALGRFLRKYSLDELPQLFNVLAGDMSIVGPRPERPVFIREFRNRIPRYMLRHKVPAGMTGWAQINGWRGDTSIDKRIEFDLYYIANWSLILDFKIIWLTLFRGIKDSNAV